ncbi:MAG TPA: metal ABC transporter substrate-binding protein [Acidimicrobiales bacterium]|nr:metal ABC transporter substrate-binding protein [Acidimicrobiales bacterium]
MFSGCGVPAARPAADGPALQVVTSAYPIAQAVTLIGGGKARVIDLAPPGSNPFSFVAGQADLSQVQRARLFVFTGATVQPGFASAEAAAAQKVDLSSATSEPYFWLDPPAMRAAVQVIETAMEGADPSNARTFRTGARDLEVELDSTGIDYQSTLSTCPRRTVFTADDAFADLAKRYNLDYSPLGTAAPPEPGVVAAESASVRSSGATAIFGETWIADSTVNAVGRSAGVKVRTLDTLLAPPPGGWPRQANYLNLLESNLGQLSDALGCAGSSTAP